MIGKTLSQLQIASIIDVDIELALSGRTIGFVRSHILSWLSSMQDFAEITQEIRDTIGID